MTSDALVINGLVFLGIVAAAAGVALLIGAALGYYAASVDLRAERAESWNLGYDARARGGARRNPYTKTALAPAPPVIRIPNPPAAHPVFDQDELSPAGRAIEIRADQ